MKIIYVNILIVIGISCSSCSISQQYLTLKQASEIAPDSVTHLKISRKKIAEIPSIVWTYRNLKALDLSKNKLTSISDSISLLKSLEVLSLRKNKLSFFPVELCALKGLTHLNLSSNQIGYIPDAIAKCSELSDLGNGLEELQHLTRLDLRGLMMNAKKQDQISVKIPRVKILFDAPCNCVD